MEALGRLEKALTTAARASDPELVHEVKVDKCVLETRSVNLAIVRDLLTTAARASDPELVHEVYFQPHSLSKVDRFVLGI